MPGLHYGARIHGYRSGLSMSSCTPPRSVRGRRRHGVRVRAGDVNPRRPRNRQPLLRGRDDDAAQSRTNRSWGSNVTAWVLSFQTFLSVSKSRPSLRLGNAAEHGPPYITAATNCGDFSAALRLGAKLPI